MYTQQVVCPSCGKAAIVNVVEPRGNTDTPCQHCHEKIYVETNDSGQVSRIYKIGCIVATACSTCLNDSGSEDELTILRDFRDRYVRHMPNGEQLLQEYYCVAPQIVHRIESQPNSEEVFRKIHQTFIVPLILQIKSGDNHGAIEAIETYLHAISLLKDTYGRSHG